MLRVMLFPMLNVLYLYISTFRSVCAVPSVTVSVIIIIIIIIIVFAYHLHCTANPACQ